MDSIIEGRGIVKRYGAFTAVKGIDFEIWPGEAFGLLGPNGAGKTSTIKMIHCVSPVTEGQLRVNGMDVMAHGREIKAHIGVVPQENNLDPDLTVLQNLLVYARYFQIPKDTAQQRTLEFLELFQLNGKENSNVETISTGMKRRLLIARALLNQPRILILDEPTTGLDPQARHLVWQKLRYLKGQGITMIVTTHNMDEAASLCDRVTIMNEGNMLAVAPPAEMVAQYVGREVMELHLKPSEKPSALTRIRLMGLAVEEVEDTLYVFAGDGQSLPQSLDVQYEKLTYRQATLEDVFLKITGRGLRE